MSNLIVDLGTSRGAPTYRGQGFLHSVSPNWPADNLIAPLKPYGWRISNYGNFDGATVDGNYARLKGLGVQKIQFLIDNLLDYSDNPYYTGATFPNGVYQNGTGPYTYETACAALAQHALDNNQDFYWDLVNEPDSPKYTFNGFYDRWKRCALAIRAKIPAAKLVGPDLAQFDYTFITNFLIAAYADGIFPAMITWHELIRPPEDSNPQNPDLYGNHQQIVDFLAAHPQFPVALICIQEYTNPFGYLYSPGSPVDYFAAAERLNILLNRASWYDFKQVDQGPENGFPYVKSDENPTLDGIITYNKFGQPYASTPSQRQSDPRGTWWAHKTYADMSGLMVNVTQSQDWDGVASKDSTAGKALILVGNRQGAGSAGSMNVVVNNIPSYLINNGQVNVKIESIPQTEAGLLSLPVVSNQGYTVTNGSITIPANINQFDAAKMTLTGTPSSNTPPSVNAGTDQSISTSSTVLTGTVSDNGSVVSQSWSKISGSGNIASYANLSTQVTGLNGTSVFRLTATDNEGLSAYDDVTITSALPITPSAPIQLWGLKVGAAPITGGTTSSTREYFSHAMNAYMAQVYTGSNLNNDLDRWIGEQQNAGYTGLWLHVDAYDGNYPATLKATMDSAARLGMKIMPGVASFTDINQAVQVYADAWDKASLYRIDGVRVFSFYDYQPTYAAQLVTALTAAGMPRNQYKLWVHSRYPVNSFASSTDEIASLYSTRGIDGLLNFAVDQGYKPQNIIDTNNYLIQGSKTAGKLSMAGISAYYSSPPGGGRHDFGYDGVAQIWQNIINLPLDQRPDGACDTTANDIGELSYMTTPLVPNSSGTINGQNVNGLNFIAFLGAQYVLGSNVGRYPLTDHSGIQKFLRPWVDAYKNNQAQPAFTADRMFAWYWLHPFGTNPDPLTGSLPAFFSGDAVHTQAWYNSTKYVVGSDVTQQGSFEKLYTELSYSNGDRVIPGYGRIRMAAHLTAPGYLKINSSMSALKAAGAAFFDIDVATFRGFPVFSIIEPDGTTVRMTGSGPQAITDNIWPGGWNPLIAPIAPDVN